MTVEEALYELKRNIPTRVFGTELYCKAYDMAIEALEKRILNNNVLKHCPFCGSEAIYEEDIRYDGHCSYQIGYVICKNMSCRISTREYIIDGYYGITTKKEDIINAWNQRYEEDKGAEEMIDCKNCIIGLDNCFASIALNEITCEDAKAIYNKIYQQGRADEQINILNWFKEMGWMQAVSAMYGYFETHSNKEHIKEKKNG